MKSIRIFSDDLEGGNFLLGSRFAPSICRSIIEENGRDVIWGKAEEEVEMIIRVHVRKIMGRSISIRNVRIFWEWDEAPDEENDDDTVFRRTDYKAVYLHGKEMNFYTEVNSNENGHFGKFCRMDSKEEGGCYLVCRKIPLGDWDRLMVGVSMRELPFIGA
ncbi:hypothetical protein IX51_07585 [uncultured archaeon]|nr:hypothetical protein IX51_07585 [uncultured archaeon]HKJ97250.1 hypothetical protein [Thermoplasmataceae archaeon]